MLRSLTFYRFAFNMKYKLQSMRETFALKIEGVILLNIKIEGKMDRARETMYSSYIYIIGIPMYILKMIKLEYRHNRILQKFCRPLQLPLLCHLRPMRAYQRFHMTKETFRKVQLFYSSSYSIEYRDDKIISDFP